MTLDQLLIDTLKHAVQAPFYQERWGERWRSVRTIDQLSRLPLIDKATASKHQARLIVGARPAGLGVVSSGTTRGEQYTDPLNVPRTAAELQASARAAAIAPDEAGWTLSVVSVHHGLPKRLEGRNELMLPWLHDANALAMLETTLRHPQPDGRRVTAMVIGSGPIKVFTSYLADRAVDPRSFGVELIGTFSYRLSSTWTHLVEQRFGARVFDNYSLSEFPTPFTTCAACGWLHAGQPPMLVELLALDADRPAKRGAAGRLVFTSLAPFVTTMPLIRYDTHDVAIAGPLCRATGQLGLKVLGRRRHGLELDGAFVCNAVDVRDVLEALPEVEKTLHPMTRLGHVKSVDLGPPRWTIAAHEGRAVLRFEVRFDPDLYRARARELEHHVATTLCALDPLTRRFAGKKRQRLVVEAARAGTLVALTERYD
ncbi:MAG: hypothetical protein JNJ54_17125 [Myxococcaceae bacterium]|nr:hypothetical protein [Myxococcaceae bacterium]